MRVLIVDDEAPARRKMRRFVNELSSWTVCGEANGVRSAIDAIRGKEPDLLLLDIHMTDGSGFDVVEALADRARPQVVFVTAFDEHAVRAFDCNAQDYLLKPVTRDRFARMVARIGEQRSERSVRGALEKVLDQMREPRWLQRVVVEDNQRGRPIAVDRILWLQADRNYVRVHARDGGGRLRATLSDLAERLDPDRFARVSRSAVINIDAVREIQAWFRGDRLFVMEDGSEIRGSRVFLGENPVLAELIGRHR